MRSSRLCIDNSIKLHKVQLHNCRHPKYLSRKELQYREEITKAWAENLWLENLSLGS